MRCILTNHFRDPPVYDVKFLLVKRRDPCFSFLQALTKGREDRETVFRGMQEFIWLWIILSIMVHSLIDIVGVDNIVPVLLIECHVQTLLAVSSAVTLWSVFINILKARHSEKSFVLLVKQLSRRSRRAFPRVGKSTKAFQPVSSPRRLISKRFMSPANTMTVLGCFSKMFSVK